MKIEVFVLGKDTDVPTVEVHDHAGPIPRVMELVEVEGDVALVEEIRWDLFNRVVRLYVLPREAEEDESGWSAELKRARSRGRQKESEPAPLPETVNIIQENFGTFGGEVPTLDPDDLQITYFRPGTRVNADDTGVHILHRPSGQFAVCGHFDSQAKNKARALEMLRDRVFSPGGGDE